MSFKFNPLTGKLDITGEATGTLTDHHCGYEEIQSPDTVIITARKQMVVFEELTLDGTLVIEGTLVLRS